MHISHRQHFFDHLAQTSDYPLALEIEKAEGVYMYSPDGKRYMDLISGIAVSNVGHRHPKVLAAVHEQLEKHMHLLVYGEFVQSTQVQLARALTETLRLESANPSPYGLIDNVYFTNSGTEAVEGAMKLAKRFTGRDEFVSCFNAYHGATQGALSLAGAEFFKRNFRPLLPGITNIKHGFLPDIEKITDKTAAVIIEIIGGESGVRVPDDVYFPALREKCNETGALLIFDEIQTGYGRTGSFWAFEQFGAYPDIVLSAKAMGGGMPIGAFMASQQIMGAFKNNPILGHITTFGGHPVSCASSLAALQVTLEENLAASANAKGDLFKSLLIHPAIKEVRGRGLMLAAEMESFAKLKNTIDRCIERGVVTDWFLFCDNAMRIAPPLTITEDQIREACTVILSVLNE
ncbi:aspartate aminotransferase family protein [Dyadobacter fanqingshengii]|uniref:Aminotransferase class III-fold pyridoxal phosphate-dependent enzyme n=1 Tax=Dyadobacter fanqingshengii TaxID=2906443 RepID=A0A9X1PBS1_9BACT|nr:aminotransferase class III-fold pyridoxal phosphate-dependent enzyme [Dyadobacter fanqingshengii]MCF0040718.1 aminotransferase class III-fold pyridoxal phosphate-dependent enzyme [Dyadobacter fanqingshengii]USJ37545.1 aminotransferase class III-fold pyridoxal phosphate-dependent enzyme [Dyadobacter fanqingshengii]